MSRSYKHTSKGGNTLARTEKQDKRFANRKYRRLINQMVTKETLPHIREVTNVYAFDKDGKQYFDAKEHVKMLRK